MADEKKSPMTLVHEASCDGDVLSVVSDHATHQTFVGGAHGQIALLDLAGEAKFPVSWAAHVSFVSSLVLTADQLISAGSDHRVIWWDRETHRPIRINEDHPRWVRGLTLSPDRHLLASVCDDMVCRLWETATGSLVRELRGHELVTPKFLRSKLYCCAFSPNGQQLATADQLGQIVVWEVASGATLARFKAPHFYTQDTNGHGYGGIRSLAFSPDGKWLAAGGNRAGDTSTIGGSKPLIRVYDWATGQQSHEWTPAGNFFFERVAFHPRGDRLLGAGGAGDGQQLVWFDLTTKEVAQQQASPMLVFDMTLSEQADVLITVGRKDAKGHIIQWAIDPTISGTPNEA